MRFGRPGETWEHNGCGAIYLILVLGDDENMATTLVLYDPQAPLLDGTVAYCDPNDVTYRRLT